VRAGIAASRQSEVQALIQAVVDIGGPRAAFVAASAVSVRPSGH
jgi:hypothetical protein